MDSKHLGISSALLCLPEPGWMRPCSALCHVPQCFFSPGGVSKSPQYRLTSGSQGKPERSPPSPCLALEDGWRAAASTGRQCCVVRGRAGPAAHKHWGRCCCPASPGAARAGWASQGCWRRQAAPSPPAGEEAAGNSLTSWSRKRPPAWDSSACLGETGWLFPAPPVPLLHQQS